MNSQASRVAGRAQALSRLMVARGSIQTLTRLLATAAIVTVVAGVFAAPSLVPVGTHADPVMGLHRAAFWH